MEQLTLDQAADFHSKDFFKCKETACSSFKAGAEWQKEQYKEVVNLMKQLIAAYDIRYPKAKQLLVGYTNEQAFEKMNILLEQLQDGGQTT